MIILFITPLIISIFNLYRRLTCKIKLKFTKFIFITLLVVFLFFIYITSFLNFKNIKYLYALVWYFSFFTSLISSGITEKGILYPFYLFSKLYKFEKLKFVKIEKNKNSFILTFKAIRELRIEFDIKDLESTKKILKQKNVKKKN